MRSLWLLLFLLFAPLWSFAMEGDTSIKAVIFDCGGVIIEHDRDRPHLFVATEFGIPYEEVKESLSKELREVSTGEEQEGLFWERYAAKYNRRPPNGWLALYMGNYRNHIELVPGMFELVGRLHCAGYLTPMLSNVIPSNVAILTCMGVYNRFRPLILSCDVGMAKPDPRIYRYALQVLGLKPEETIFVDDSLENVEAAREVGMHAVQFHSASQLEEALEGFGVTTYYE